MDAPTEARKFRKCGDEATEKGNYMEAAGDYRTAAALFRIAKDEVSAMICDDLADCCDDDEY